MCDAIAYAHHRRVLHRDLQPDHVRVGDFGDVQVLGWRYAKPLAPVQRRDSDIGSGRRSEEEREIEVDAVVSDRRQFGADITMDGEIVGTLGYMCPEQARGDAKHAKEAADIYGIGAILYHVLTGRAPVLGTHPLKIRNAIAAGDITAPTEIEPEVPAELEAICLKAIALDPYDRYRTVHELKADLECWYRGERVAVATYSRLARLQFWARQNPMLAAITIAVWMLAVVGVLFTVVLLKQAELDAAHDQLDQQLIDAPEPSS